MSELVEDVSPLFVVETSHCEQCKRLCVLQQRSAGVNVGISHLPPANHLTTFTYWVLNGSEKTPEKNADNNSTDAVIRHARYVSRVGSSQTGRHEKWNTKDYEECPESCRCTHCRKVLCMACALAMYPSSCPWCRYPFRQIFYLPSWYLETRNAMLRDRQTRIDENVTLHMAIRDLQGQNASLDDSLLESQLSLQRHRDMADRLRGERNSARDEVIRLQKQLDECKKQQEQLLSNQKSQSKQPFENHPKKEIANTPVHRTTQVDILPAVLTNPVTPGSLLDTVQSANDVLQTIARTTSSSPPSSTQPITSEQPTPRRRLLIRLPLPFVSASVVTPPRAPSPMPTNLSSIECLETPATHSTLEDDIAELEDNQHRSNEEVADVPYRKRLRRR